MLSTLAIVTATTAVGQDLERTVGPALEQARQLVAQHRYSEVIELLEPFAQLDDPETQYAVSSELGRAHFHLGDYSTADALFRNAVRLRPRRVESALYLEATSYLTGHREQAYRILREVLASGATDLYLAVTLPGERAFLADSEVRRILGDMSRPIDIDIDRGSVLGVEIGNSRADVEQELSIDPGPAPPSSALTASAGPYLTWAFGFGDDGALLEIIVYNEHLLRYTPYRMSLGRGLDWRATPATATRTLGAPTSTSHDGDDVAVMAWNRGGIELTLEFAPPREPTPPGIDGPGPMLQVLRMRAAPESEPEPEPESDSDSDPVPVPLPVPDRP